MTKQSPEERRERARLASERWRRAHGIMPRKPVQRPWLALGVSRSTYYRRKAKARSQAALIAATAAWNAMLDRLDWQLTDLRAAIDRAARYQAIAAAVIAETAVTEWQKRKAW